MLRTRRTVLTLLLGAASALAQRGPAIPQQLTFAPDHATGIYDVGGTVGWTVTPGPVTPTYLYKWTARRNNAVVLKEGKSVQGTVTTNQGRVAVAGQTVPLSDVEAMRNAEEQHGYERLLHPGLHQLWVATGTLGFAGTAGNAKTDTFTTGFSASRATRTDKITLNFNAIRASAVVNGTSDETASAVRGGIGYDHNVSKRLFLNAFNNYEHDRFQNLVLEPLQQLDGYAGHDILARAPSAPPGARTASLADWGILARCPASLRAIRRLAVRQASRTMIASVAAP
jgi:hypothetical protein